MQKNESSRLMKHLSKGYIRYLKEKEIHHNIIAQIESKENTLEYNEDEARVLTCYIRHAQVNNQIFNPKQLRNMVQKSRQVRVSVSLC